MTNTKPVVILYAEDDEEDRFFFLEGVKCVNENVQIVTAENGQDAIDYLAAIAPDQELPAAIVSDLSMPLCDGLDMLRRVKNEGRWKHIPVVLFSTSSSRFDVSMATQLGAEAFFTKPETVPEFMKTVQTILALCKEPRNEA
ncbi:MAG TPA: response regulator [Flavisolibacter sp.]|nr:response regulator [Flavisolibacter sp.]